MIVSTPIWNRISRFVLFFSIATLVISCMKESGGGSADDNPLPQVSEEVLNEELAGVSNRMVNVDWADGTPGTDKVRMMSAAMVESEFERFAGMPIVEGEDARQEFIEALGDVDFRKNWLPDRNVSSQKLVRLQTVFLEATERLIDRESNAQNRSLFTELDPTAPIDGSNPAVETMISKLFSAVFFESAEEHKVEIDSAKQLLLDIQEQESPKQAWMGMLSAWMLSARFLTY